MNLENSFFHQDRASIHNEKTVITNFQKHYSGRWISRKRGVMFWPSNLPDLTPCDFYLWGRIKQKTWRKDSKGWRWFEDDDWKWNLLFIKWWNIGYLQFSIKKIQTLFKSGGRSIWAIFMKHFLIATFFYMIFWLILGHPE